MNRAALSIPLPRFTGEGDHPQGGGGALPRHNLVFIEDALAGAVEIFILA